MLEKRQQNEYCLSGNEIPKQVRNDGDKASSLVFG